MSNLSSTNNFNKQLHDALNRLKSVFPQADNTVGFELESSGDSGYTLPSFFATSNHAGAYMLGTSPDHAVTRLIRSYGITRVEEYIRCKEAQQ